MEFLNKKLNLAKVWYACCYCFLIKAQNELPKPSFLSFFWFILCFVKWNEKNLLLKDMKSREELFLLSLHIQRAMPETVATTKNEVNSARIELRPLLMCSIFFSSLFCRLREDEEERTKPGNRREQSPLALERRWRVSQLRLTGFAKTHFTVNSLSDRHLLTPRNQGTYYTSITYLKYTEFLKYYKNTLFFQVLQIL